MEYLRTPASGGRRVGIALSVSVVAVVIVGVAFAWWSDTVRTSANAAFVEALGSSTARVVSGDRQVQGTLAYASPMIWSSAVPADVRAGLRDLVQGSAAEVSADLGATADRVAGVRVLPWQGAQAQSRDALLALIGEQQRRFDRIAADAAAIGRVLSQEPPSAALVVQTLRASGATELPLR
jgi:hypothetical protein